MCIYVYYTYTLYMYDTFMNILNSCILQIFIFVAERVSNPKRLRGGIKFVDSIPKTPSGKILRRVLRDRLKSKL